MRPPFYFASLIVSFSVALRAGQAGDVTPDPGLFFTNTSEGLALAGESSVLATSGRPGFHRTDSGGKDWQRAMNGFVDSAGVEPFASGFCQAPSAAATVYSFSNVALGRPHFRTDDLGNSWRSTGAIGPLMLPIDCAVDPSNQEALYVLAVDFATFTVSLFKSTDGARTWTPLAGLPPLDGPQLVRVSPTNPQTLYVGNVTGDANDGIYVSHDGGASFKRLPASPQFSARLAAHPTRDGTLFVASFDGSLFRSTDGGATFAQVGPVNSKAFDNPSFVAFDPKDSSVVYLAAGPAGLHRSRDFGATFAHVAPAADQVGPSGVLVVGVAPSRDHRTHVYVSTDRGPYRSDDGANSFTSIRNTYRGAPVNDLAIDARGRLMVAALHTVVAYRAQSAGHPDSYESFGVKLTTTQTDFAGEWSGSSVAPSSVAANAAVVSTFTNGVFSTTDGGGTWTRATLAPAFEGDFGSFIRVRFAPGNASRVYLIEHRFGLYRSDDAGRSFQRLFDERLGGIAVDPDDPDVIYLGAFDTGNGLFKSVNGGHTVRSLAVPGNFSTLAIDPRHTKTVYAGNTDGGVLRSLNGGATWAPASTGLPPSGEVLAVAVDPQIPARVYAWVRGGGLFVSGDGGRRWTAADTGEALRRSSVEAGRAAMVVDPVVPGRVYIGNSGVVQIDTLGQGTN
ncbi:MAG: hypothetical protein E6J63_16865 [Deltaproteobacteria bacterium]|nr:MAG: hypothetical protein E6J63_16865 [Deltaproteobacteria bacterium]